MQRKLTTIIVADVVGYAGLMEANEAGTLGALKANRADIFDPSLKSFGGRLVKLMGDGALAEFSSVIAAMNCALAIQERTEALADSGASSIRYRIGVNLGEVIAEDDDIYGEGVNVAARLQALAPVGGIAVAGVVRDQVAGKIACALEDTGQHRVKNMDRPLHVFLVRPGQTSTAAEPTRQISVCVLPFVNVSDDAQQEYFSDGITEDVITDLSKVSALFVIGRNTAFTFKGQKLETPKIARQLRVSHIVEGSVRKSGQRVRITAQLIDGATGGHVWGERFDRDLSDIFALQDEVSEAIVAALKLRLLPEEKQAIEQRGTDNPEAFNLYLLARENQVNPPFEADHRAAEAIVRLCTRAVELDPNYAQAWALLSIGQTRLRFQRGRVGDDGLAAAERALSLNPRLAAAHAVKAEALFDGGRIAEAAEEIDVALSLDAHSYDAHRAAGAISYRQHRFGDAVLHFESASDLMPTDISSVAMLMSANIAIGDAPGAERAAERTLERAERSLAQNRNDSGAIGYSAFALSALGKAEQARDRMSSALLIDPENLTMRYNFACALMLHLKDVDGTLAMLAPYFAKASAPQVDYAKIDPDFEPIRDDPRLRAMIAGAEARLRSDG